MGNAPKEPTDVKTEPILNGRAEEQKETVK
jgi:hypothetical protein